MSFSWIKKKKIEEWSEIGYAASVLQEADISRLQTKLSTRRVLSFGLSPPAQPSRSGDVAVDAFDINQASLPTPFVFCSWVSVSVFMLLSAVFYFVNSPDNSPRSHCVLPVLFLPYWSFQLYASLFMKVSLSFCGWLGLIVNTGSSHGR